MNAPEDAPPKASRRRAARKPVSPPVPTFSPILNWITGTDLSAALRTARKTTVAGSLSLEDEAKAASRAVQKAVAGCSVLRMPRFDEWIEALRGIETACASAVEEVTRRLPESPPYADADVLPRLIAHSRDPVVRALRGAATAHALSEGRGVSADDVEAAEQPPAAELADIIVRMARLGGWAASAKEGFAAGRGREKALQDEVTSPGRELGFRLIGIYLRAIGATRPTLSRPSNKNGAGRPGGPLIRYLVHLFDGIQARLAGEVAYARIARNRSLAPSPETLASWIAAYQKQPNEPSSRGEDREL